VLFQEITMGGLVKYRYILFDADEVLFDFSRAEGTAFNAACAAFALDARALHAPYEEINSRLWKRFAAQQISGEELRVQRFKELFEQQHIQLDAAAVSARYIAELTQCGFLLPGALDVVQYCKAHCTIGLITNGLADVQRGRLAVSGLDAWFETIVISEEVGYPKPHPEIFRHACQTMKAPHTADVLMVGDSYESDIVGAHEFGIDTCWVNIHQRNDVESSVATYEINEIKELIPVIKESI
jgi:YjjG family noncanonical pyrimidine nucleotidase